MSLLGSTVRLGNFSPNVTTPVSFNATAVVAQNAVEFDNISQYDIPTDSRGMVNADIDLTADQLTYTIDDDFFTNFLAGTFTGPTLEDITPGGPEFYRASISPIGNTLGLEAADVFVTATRLYINVQGISFNNGDGFTLNLGFLYQGDNLNNTIIGGGYSDRILGFGGNDLLGGGRGPDGLFGGIGNDTLNGGQGADLMAGGYGNDRYVSDNISDRIVEVADAGTDTIVSFVSRGISPNVENLTLAGAAVSGFGNTLANSILGNDLANTLSGGGGSDRLYGANGKDLLVGGTGNDWLYGGIGNDRLIGGVGLDRYVGQGGADTFVFTIPSGRDVILGYQTGIDHIGLALIDANSLVAGNQAFDFVGGAAFSASGDLRYAAGVLSGDVNGDGVADFSITIGNHPATLLESDLIL